MNLIKNYVSFYLNKKSKSQKDLKFLQDNLWQNFIGLMHQYPAFANYNYTDLSEFPIINIAEYRANFHKYNKYGLTAEMAVAAAENQIKLENGLSAGLSTGTSGTTRGIFLTNDAERATYIAQILAKAFTFRELLTVRKIALCLRANNDLYQKVGGGRINFKFFPLDVNRDEIAAQIREFAPDVLIAPTQILLKLAKGGKTKIRHIFYGAEVMNNHEYQYIYSQTGIKPLAIYQATEGFIGIGCECGNIKINEDSLIIEREYIDAQRFVPIITDLRRISQAIIRLKLDDIWQEAKCGCGHHGLCIKPLEGRVGDIWHLGRDIYPSEIIDKISDKINPSNLYCLEGSAENIKIICEAEGDAKIIENAMASYNHPIEVLEYDDNVFFPKLRHVKWRH